MIWLIGSNGMLGTEVKRALSEKKFDFTPTDREVDITDINALERFAEKVVSDGKKIDFIINCSAYTAVDAAESDAENAEKLNAGGPENIAKIAHKYNADLIHISTDYVFSGNGNTPWKENDETAPESVYGKTKALGEKRIIENTEKYYIFRTAWLYGFNGKNFVYTMLRAINSRESVKVVADQKGSPTFAGVLADIIIKTVEKRIPYGIYHTVGTGETTWFEFTKEIFKKGIEAGLVTNEKCIVNSCTTEEYPTAAKRPAYSVLNTEKIQNALGIKIPDWKESLEKFLNDRLFDKTRIDGISKNPTSSGS